jgi:hypothetical protein
VWLSAEVVADIGKLIDHDDYMGVFPTQVEMLYLKIDDLRTIHSSYITCTYF